MLDKLKGAWRSVTIWFNGLLLALFPLVQMAHDSLPEIGQYLSPHLYQYVGLAVVVVNIALRFKTTSDLASK